MLKEYDALVVGGGISGLTSALLLAARGKKTAVLEAGATLSPVIHGFERNGVRFETGFHYASNLGQNEFGGYIFKKLGLNLRAVPLLRNGYDEIHLIPTGRVFKMAYGRENLEKNLCAAFPEEKNAIKSYLDKVRENIDKSAFLNMHKNENGNYGAAVDIGETLQEVLDSYFKSEEIKAVLSVSAFLHGTPPAKISFGQHCCVAGGLYDSAWEIEGGGEAVLREFGAALKKAGVDVFLKTKVIKIEEKDGKKSVSAENGAVFICDTCVSAVHPKIFFDIAPANVYREGYKKRVSDISETPGFFTLYGVLKNGKYFEKSNIFTVRDMDINNIFSPDMKTRSYYINFSHSSPQALSIISLVPPDAKIWDKTAPDYKEKKEKYAELVKKDMEELFPEIAQNIEYVAVSTPATMQSYAGYYGGYGLMHEADKTKILPMTKIPGLFVTGQSVVAPGLLGAIITSLLTDKITEGGL